MVRFSVRSLAFMALSFVAAASPVAQGFNQPAAAAAVAPAAVAPAAAAFNYAAPAPAIPADVDNRNRDIAYQAAPNVAPQQTTNKPQGRPQEKCVMVPCSKEECLKNMTPEEQAEFRAQCDTMKREEIQKAGASGKSRVSAGGVDMSYYQMYTPQEAAQKGIRIDGKTAFLTSMTPSEQALNS
ncbi:hypothetical protein GGF43_003413 [Coemansia sp. RSA 2618]|nr:hypothetical protein GGF43_003413 [Coemansia sp. RSA 2618]